MVLFGTALLTPPLLAAAPAAMSLEAARRHWAFQPIRRPSPPAVRDSGRLRSPVDAFVESALAARGETLAAPAAPRDRMRRVYFDLTGLPPERLVVEAFERDPSPEAFVAVVDRLLASPQYGERWGRHWLDVARYADTKDLVLVYGRDALRPYAYTYRDYVIRAFNEDLPYDEFLRDQLAADLATPAVASWRLAALGFLTLGRLFDNNPHDQIDDQIDTVTRGLLGLTVSCARCHDHKYDAISIGEYYGLYGVFASTERPYVLPLIEDPAAVPGGPEFEERLAAARRELDDHLDAEHAKLTGILRSRLGDYLVRAATTEPDLTETAQFGLSLTPEDFRPALMLRTRRLLAARVNLEDRVFGPWASLTSALEDAPDGQAVRLVVPPDVNWNPQVIAALEGRRFTDRAAVARAYGELLLAMNDRHARDGSGDVELVALVSGPDAPMTFPRRETPAHMSRPDKDRYSGLAMALDKLAAHATNRPPARAMIVADLPEPLKPRIFLRGNPSRLGPEVPRAFLRALGDGEPHAFVSGSGRRELAEAIVSPDNPLTARVLVNRVWMHHFGEPLVGTPSEFGARSDPPVLPELLDWLAAEFIGSGWSLKSLHRTLLLSATYAQAVRTPISGTAASEPGAVLRRRLDLEAMRDSLLQVSGRLDLTLGGPPGDAAGDPLNVRRTVYGLVDRQNLPSLFRTFDFAAPDQCVERRPSTTVPQQALFALNAPFVLEQARALASLPEVVAAEDPGARVAALFRRVLGREPSVDEIRDAVRFVEVPTGGDAPAGPWELLAQMLMISNEAVFLD